MALASSKSRTIRTDLLRQWDPPRIHHNERQELKRLECEGLELKCY